MSSHPYRSAMAFEAMHLRLMYEQLGPGGPKAFMLTCKTRYNTGPCRAQFSIPSSAAGDLAYKDNTFFKSIGKA